MGNAFLQIGGTSFNANYYGKLGGETGSASSFVNLGEPNVIRDQVWAMAAAGHNCRPVTKQRCSPVKKEVCKQVRHFHLPTCTFTCTCTCRLQVPRQVTMPVCIPAPVSRARQECRTAPRMQCEVLQMDVREQVTTTPHI